MASSFMTGVTGAACIAMGLIALPAMLKRGYDKRLAIGSVLGPSTLGILIPPSIIMVFIAVVGQMSVGKLFIAGVMPGLLIASLFIGYYAIRGLVQPKACPASPLRYSLREKIAASRGIVLPLFIILAVLGSIFFGIATPTEASAVGAFVCLIAVAIQRRFTWKLLKEAAYEAFKINALCMWITFGAICFSTFYAHAGGTEFISRMLLGLGLGRWGILILIQVLLFALGLFLDNFAVILLIAPVALPVIRALGFDPIWFAILFVINTQIAYISPPFGYNLFYMSGIALPGITLGDIYRAAIVPMIILAIGLALVTIFPEIALWLPRLMIQPGR